MAGTAMMGTLKGAIFKLLFIAFSLINNLLPHFFKIGYNDIINILNI